LVPHGTIPLTVLGRKLKKASAFDPQGGKKGRGERASITLHTTLKRLAKKGEGATSAGMKSRPLGGEERSSMINAKGDGAPSLFLNYSFGRGITGRRTVRKNRFDGEKAERRGRTPYPGATFANKQKKRKRDAGAP